MIRSTPCSQNPGPGHDVDSGNSEKTVVSRRVSSEGISDAALEILAFSVLDGSSSVTTS